MGWGGAVTLLLMAILFGYWQLRTKQGLTPLISSPTQMEQLALSLKQVAVAQQYSELLKAISVSIDSEVVKIDTPIAIEKTEQGFAVRNRIRLAFFNHSELYVKVSGILPNIAKQIDHTYAVDIDLDQQPLKDIVVPPLGKATADVFFTTRAQCLLKSFVVSWQYNYTIDDPSLDFIFHNNQALRQQAQLVIGNLGVASQIVVNHSDLKSVQAQTEDFCQYEI